MIVLASGSPRRRELLSMVTDEFLVVPARGEELAQEIVPENIVKELAMQKAQEVAMHYPKDIVIGCDTVVALDGVVYGKPKDKTHATEMLQLFSGKTHFVHTGVALVKNGKVTTFVATTEVTFKSLTEKQIADYITTKNPYDKAGSYGIQDCDFVEKIDGSYYNVMGLPVEILKEKLSKISCK